MKILNLVSIFFVLMVGCKAKKPLTPIAFPCPTVSIIEKIDTVHETKYTPTYTEKTVIKEVQGKTVEIKTTDTIYVPSKSIIVYRTIEKQVENLSRVQLAQFQRDSINKLLNDSKIDFNALKSSYDRLSGGSRTKSIIIGSLFLLFLLIALFVIWLYRKSFKMSF